MAWSASGRQEQFENQEGCDGNRDGAIRSLMITFYVSTSLGPDDWWNIISECVREDISERD